jgi:glyoxylase I family protein
MKAVSVRPGRLHHHAFVVKDQETTRRFYEDVIGLPDIGIRAEGRSS